MRRTGEEGAVYVEFLAVVGPLLVLLLGLIQLALVYGAHLLVCHAAGRAARAAIVVLPDDHEEADYGGVPLNTVGGSGEGLDAYAAAPGGGRLSAIRDAARLTLSPISPPLSSFVGNSSVTQAISGSTAVGVIAGLLGWTNGAVAVSFPDGDGGYRTTFAPRGPVTVRVTYVYRCRVPLARDLVCREYADLGSAAASEIQSSGSVLGGLALTAGWRLIALSAERTLPNQGR